MSEEKEAAGMLKKNVWFFHHYAAPTTMNGQIRPFNFSKLLIRQGVQPTIFAASYLHHSDYNLIKDGRKYLLHCEEGIPFVFVNTPSSSKGMLARIWNMVAFYLRLMGIVKNYAKEYGAPGIIVASSPHPLTLIAGIHAAKKFKVPCICEVRDLWPEAIFTFGKLKETSLIGRCLIAGEHWIYRQADAIIFTKEGDTDYIKEHKWDLANNGDIDLNKCHYINNGVNIKDFQKSIETNSYIDSDLDDKKFNVIYAGSIRPVNDVGTLLDAAKKLIEYTNIQILIYGDGNQKEALEKRIIDEKISNVKIKGYIDKRFIPNILSKSSVNILNYSQSKYNWSRGNSSNKLFEYMASGRPIISTVKMGYCILEKYQCGISVENTTPDELAAAILKIYRMPKEDYADMGLNAKKGAADFDYYSLTKKLLKVFESLERK